MRDFLPAYEIPTEQEARIVAKCIAVKLCGDDGVKRYIAQKIDDADRLIPKNVKDGKAIKDEIEDWQFVQQLDTIFYDLASGTRAAFHRFPDRRDEFKKKLQDLKSQPAFKDIDIDLSRYYQT